ncbi:MAG: hypothetical protein IH587_02560 [Anaerolineae bacterium]|nr:hypothetical protein [Anaerolineae bacterium]
MRQLIIACGIFLVANIIIVVLGLTFAAPGLFTIALCATGPGFFLTLGAAFGRFSRDYTIVSKDNGRSRAMHRPEPLG